MKVKVLEIMDAGTFIPALAVEVAPENEGQRYLISRCAYRLDRDQPNVILTRLDGSGKATNDPYVWPHSPRTMRAAHMIILRDWDKLADGDVVCVETFLGLRADPKKSERFTGLP